MLPVNLNFRMPAEWEKRSRSFMEWPVREEIWPNGLQEARKGYAEIAKAIAGFEELVMISEENLAEEVRSMCGDKVKIVTMEHDDSWVRDNGPTFIVNDQGNIAGVNWGFNAWGEKYMPFDKDNLVAKKLLDLYNIPVFDAPFILEGGSIHVDGEGTLITTEECLLNKNRNPNLSRMDIEKLLKAYLNIEKIIWLKKGLYGDETDGHVDNVACFAKPGVIVTQICNDKSDPNYERSLENIELLKNSTDAKGRNFEVVTIEQPPVRFFNEERLTLSYINYYPVTGAIILPVFGGDAKESDENAIKILQNVYPDRKIVTVDGMPIIKGGGNVHCITQQMPFGTPAKLY